MEFSRLRDQAIAAPIDPASLAAFRILFGLVLAVSTIRFIVLGWIDEFYVSPSFHFTWAAFPWVRPLPPVEMHLLFAAMAALAIGIAIGFRYRTCATLFFLAFTYVELIDKTTYLNHYYLVTLLSGLLIVMPAARVWSVDAWLKPRASATIPAWTVNLLRFQLAVVFFFAGLAKLNADWLIDAQPLRIWLAARSDLPIVGPLLGQVWTAYAFSWFGVVYDLSISFFLMWRRTRWPAYVTVIVFHVMTGVLFPIGMFPWIMIAATTIFFAPDWPRRWLSAPRDAIPANVTSRPASTAGVILVIGYAVIQLVVPLRAYWPGLDPEWTGRGFNFAWRVMLVEKAGDTEFAAYDPRSGRHWVVKPRDFVSERQEKMMAQDPFMVLALGRHIAGVFRASGLPAIQVRAESFAALNGRPAQRMIDPRVDLAGPLPDAWIVPRARSLDSSLTNGPD